MQIHHEHHMALWVKINEVFLCAEVCFQTIAGLAVERLTSVNPAYLCLNLREDHLVDTQK